MQNPVVGGREAEQAYICVFACRVMEFDGIVWLGVFGRGSTTDFDAYVVLRAFGTIGDVVCFPVQEFYGGGYFLNDIVVKTPMVGVNKHNGQIVGLRKSAR